MVIEQAEVKQCPKISVEIRPGRWGKIIHLFDAAGAEITLPQKDALKLARTIIRIAGKRSKK